ncbi:MAG: hypothetical protein HY055_16015 [Magnetospirillum sp.]|nr:hypothetical protein [Magnetospirillum sp.]
MNTMALRQSGAASKGKAEAKKTAPAVSSGVSSGNLLDNAISKALGLDEAFALINAAGGFPATKEEALRLGEKMEEINQARQGK